MSDGASVFLTCQEVLFAEGERLANPAVSEEAEASREEPALLLSVVDILQVDLGGELVSLHHRVGLDRTGVGTAVHLHSHTDSARVLAVREEPHLAGHQSGLQVLLPGHVGVPVGLQHLVAGGVGVEVPGLGGGSPVLQLVALGELLSLPPAIPAHGLGRGDPVVPVQVDLQPLPHPGRDGLGWTPGSSLHVLPGPAHVGPNTVLVEG